jgi:hypothetical protein
MPEHYPKSTVEVSVWCDPCGKATMHRVDDGRRGPCLECLKNLNDAALARPTSAPAPATQEKLFKPGQVTPPMAGEVLAIEAGAENMYRSPKQGNLFPKG